MKRNYKVVYYISFFLNVVLIFGIIFFLNKYKTKISNNFEFKNSYKIVMYGNSLTYQCDWSEELNRNDIKNSGKGGFTSSHLVLMLQEKVLKFKPKICFIEGGINDFSLGIPMNRTYQNYENMVDTLLKYKIQPVLQSPLFVNLVDDSISNSKIDSMNIFLRELSVRRHLIYMDLNKSLSVNKRLKSEFTVDGVHLNSRAYSIWIAEIKKVLNTIEK